MIQKLINELGFSQKTTCKLYCDNKAAISILGNSVQHGEINDTCRDQ